MLQASVQERVRSVAAGRAHCLAVTSLGRVLAWGNNAYGQCGRPVIEQEDYAVNQVRMGGARAGRGRAGLTSRCPRWCTAWRRTT